MQNVTLTDGYTSACTLDGALLEYRPALQPERLTILARAARASHVRQVYLSVLDAHVCFWEGATAALLNIEEALKAVLGIGQSSQEQADAENLYFGTILWRDYPHLTRVSCETCAKYQFDPLTGYFSRRGETRVLRPPGDSLLCQTLEGCPKGTPQNQRVLSAKNQQALAFDLDCRAVGRWPDDPIVRRNARIIGRALQEAA